MGTMHSPSIHESNINGPFILTFNVEPGAVQRAAWIVRFRGDDHKGACEGGVEVIGRVLLVASTPQG